MPRLRWIYVLKEDYTYNILRHLPAGWCHAYAFVDGQGIRRAELRANGDLTVLKTYAWDGCTPKWSLFGHVVGTPDGPIHPVLGVPRAYYASLIHDVLCQFRDVNPDVPRVVADKIFLEILTRDDFAPRGLYYCAVRAFGWFSHVIKRRSRDYKGRRLPLPAQSSDIAEVVSLNA